MNRGRPGATAEINGETVPLADCDWVLWRACGCPQGVTVGRLSPTEDDAWKSLYDGSWKAIAHATRRGERVELMTHERYVAEVSDRMSVRCPHETTTRPEGREREDEQ